MESTVNPKRRWWPWLKWSLFLIVLVGVGSRGWTLWKDIKPGELRFSPAWFVAAVMCYIAGLFPSAAFWTALLRRFGAPISFARGIRAHYCGQPGKYLPGKALVLMIRSSLAAVEGVRVSTAAVTATYETLVTMSAGLVLTAMLAPWVITKELIEARRMPISLPESEYGRWTYVVIVLAISIAGLLVATRMFGLAARKLLPAQFRTGDEGQWSKLGDLWTIGWYLCALGGWFIHGLGMGCTICSVTTQPFDLTHWPQWTAAAAGSTAVAFLVVIAPAGVGVREDLIAEILHSLVGGGAIVVAGMYRGVSFAGEIIAAAVLYYAFRNSAGKEIGQPPGTAT